MTVIIIGLVPALLLLSGSALLFFKTKTEPTLLQLLGTGCLMVVVIAHVCEAFGLFPWMGWGRPDSAGHYLDLVSAVIALTLFPVGFVWHALRARQLPTIQPLATATSAEAAASPAHKKEGRLSKAALPQRREEYSIWGIPDTGTLGANFRTSVRRFGYKFPHLWRRG